MKIGNIIYEKELVNHTEVKYINYFKEPKEYDKLDKTLPTLYVGWSFMKASNTTNEIIQHADILKKRIITNELYWEFSFEESKASHVKGIQNFVNLVPQFYFQPKYQYINLDPVFFQISDIVDLVAVLPKERQVVYNLKNEMIYVIGKDNTKHDCIWGINLLMYKFFQFNIEEIIDIFQNSHTAHYINDFTGQMYMNQYKIFPNFSYLKRYMPVIMSK